MPIQQAFRLAFSQGDITLIVHLFAFYAIAIFVSYVAEMRHKDQVRGLASFRTILSITMFVVLLLSLVRPLFIFFYALS